MRSLLTPSNVTTRASAMPTSWSVRATLRQLTFTRTSACASLQRDAAAHGARARMPRLDADLRPARRIDHPLQLRKVGRRLVVRPPGRRARFDPALQLADHGLHLAADEP